MTAPPDTSDCHMFCRGCGYALIGLPSNRCPECGRDFDPANPRTFLARPRRLILRRVAKIVLVLFCLTLPADVYFGYLAWRARQESQAIQFLRVNGMWVTTYDTAPSWAKAIFRGRADWLWTHAEMITADGYYPPKNVPTCMAAMENLRHLRKLRLIDITVTEDDLAHIEDLTALEQLRLRYSKVTDAGLVHLNPLRNLQELDLHETNVTDAGLVHLQGLRSLQRLTLTGTHITDAGLPALKGLTGLRLLELGGAEQVTDVGVADLRTALPNCTIKD